MIFYFLCLIEQSETGISRRVLHSNALGRTRAHSARLFHRRATGLFIAVIPARAFLFRQMCVVLYPQRDPGISPAKEDSQESLAYEMVKTSD